MNRVVLMLLVGIAVVAAETHQDHCCSAEDSRRVQKQWNTMFDLHSTKQNIGLGRLILLKLVERSPDAKATFKRVDIDHPNGPDFSAHALRVISGLDMVVNLLSDPEALDEALSHLADQHQVRTGVKKSHFEIIGEVLDSGLGRLLDNYDSLAWKSCINGVLKKIASKLPA